ncbi:MAG: hypothetical protein AB8F26_05675 [Phycisphaerales bacterium]
MVWRGAGEVRRWAGRAVRVGVASRRDGATRDGFGRGGGALEGFFSAGARLAGRELGDGAGRWSGARVTGSGDWRDGSTG